MNGPLPHRTISLLPGMRLLAPPLGSEPMKGASAAAAVRSDPGAELGSEAAPTAQVPLLWLDPPWYRTAPETGAACATAAVAQRVLAAWLSSDFGGAQVAGPRICPYRPERLGLVLEDLRQAAVVNLMLQPTAADALPPRWPAEVLRRYHPYPEQLRPEQLRSESVLDARRWPADVPTAEKLAGKVAQLRELAHPEAKIWITIGPDRIAADGALAVSSGADGIVLRGEGLAGAELLAAVRAAAEVVASAPASSEATLTVSAGVTEAADALKLIALGADWVAIDAVLEEPLCAAEPPPAPANSSWLSALPAAPTVDLPATLVARRIETFSREMDAWRRYCGVREPTELRAEGRYAIR